MRFATLLFLLAVCALRLCLAGNYDLIEDEAYYFMWSERLDWGYYSKGPGVAVAIKAATSLLGVSEFGLRWISPVLGFLTAWLLSGLARRLYGEGPALWTAVLAACVPIFNVGGVLLTIDPLSIFFWTAALCTLWRALEASPRFTLWWPLTGLWIALGFVCKFTNAIQLVSILLLLLWVPKWRRELRSAGFWSMLLVSALGLIPPVLWNMEHAWITVTHLLERGGFDASAGRRWTAIFEFLGQQALVHSPFIWLGLMVALFRGFGEAGSVKAGRAEKARFLLAMALPILLFYTVLPLLVRKPGEPNWTGLAFPALLIFGTMWWHERARVSAGMARYAVFALAFGAIASAVILDTDLLRSAGAPIPYRKDPGGRLRAWQATADAVETTRRQVEKELGEKVFLIADRYQLAAELNWYLRDRRVEFPGHPRVYLPESQAFQNQFSFWGRYDEFTDPDPAKTQRLPNVPDNEQPEGAGESRFAGRSALFITENTGYTAPLPAVEEGFAEWKCVARYEIKRRGLLVRTITIFLLKEYRGLSL